MYQIWIEVLICCLIYHGRKLYYAVPLAPGSAYQLQEYSHSPAAFDFLQYITKTIDNKLQNVVGDSPGEREIPFNTDQNHDLEKRHYEMLSDPCAEVVRHERLYNLYNKKGEPREFAPDFRADIYTCRSSGSTCAGLQAPSVVQEVRKTICKERMGWILARVWNPNKSTSISYEMVGPVPRGCFCGIRTA